MKLKQRESGGQKAGERELHRSQRDIRKDGRVIKQKTIWVEKNYIRKQVKDVREK